MRIACIGGGAAGLYFAISMKLRDAAHEIIVIERNTPDNTFGWGVVFSDATIQNLRDNDPASAQAIFDSFAHWDDIDVHLKSQTVTSGGHGFCGISRSRMLDILQNRATELGIEITYEKEVESLEPYLGYDLVVAADGINSRVRETYAEKFEPSIDLRKNRFIWLGTHHKFDAFTFIFIETEHGWVWAHAYRFDDNTCTFIVEMSDDTWQRGLVTCHSRKALNGARAYLPSIFRAKNCSIQHPIHAMRHGEFFPPFPAPTGRSIMWF